MPLFKAWKNRSSDVPNNYLRLRYLEILVEYAVKTAQSPVWLASLISLSWVQILSLGTIFFYFFENRQARIKSNTAKWATKEGRKESTNSWNVCKNPFFFFSPCFPSKKKNFLGRPLVDYGGLLDPIRLLDVLGRSLDGPFIWWA